MNFKEITIIADECYNLQEELTELEIKLIEKTKLKSAAAASKKVGRPKKGV